MNQNDHTETPKSADDTPVLSWTTHLARQQPEKLLVIVPAIAAAAICANWIGGMPAVLIVAAVLLSSLADFLFPVRYTLTTESATCKRLFGVTEIQWNRVRHCYLDELGVKLSPLPRRTRLEAYRGVYLRFNDNKDEVVETVRSLRPGNA